MEIQIGVFNQNLNCYTSNTITDIVLSYQDSKYQISVNDLLEYLKSKNTLIAVEKGSTGTHTQQINPDLNKRDIIHTILQERNDDTIDEFTNMKDDELIYVVNILLKDAKKSKINEYYKQKNTPYRPFNLIGLVSNNKIECESKRKTIRELCRKCYDFLYSNYKKSFESKILSNKLDLEIIQNPKSENKNIPSEIFSKTCIYKFKRGDKKNQICGNISLENENYCKMCILMKTNIKTPLITTLIQKS
jgi:hypothetical protein